MRPRDLIIILSLAFLLFSEAASFRRWELKRRALQLPKLAGLSVEEAERAGSLYEFDPGFGSFLEAVRQRVPSGASVAVSVPATSRLYFYTAHYALAPRPVTEYSNGATADFLAVYRGPGGDGDSAPSRIPGGSLRALR